MYLPLGGEVEDLALEWDGGKVAIKGALPGVGGWVGGWVGRGKSGWVGGKVGGWVGGWVRGRCMARVSLPVGGDEEEGVLGRVHVADFA